MILMPLFFQATFPFVSSPFLHLFWRLKQILASWVSLCVTSLWRMISSKVAPKGAITVVSSEDVDHDAASPVLVAGRTLAFAAPLLVETDWKMTPVRSKTVKEKNRVKFGGKWEKCHQSHCCLELPYKNLCKLLYTFRPWTDFMVKCLVTLAQETDEKGAAEPSNPLGFRCWIFFTGAWVVWNGFGFRQGGKKLEGLATWKILEFSSSRTVTRSYSSTPLSEEMVMGLDDGIAEEKDIMLHWFFCERTKGCVLEMGWLPGSSNAIRKKATQRHTWASAKSWIQEE